MNQFNVQLRIDVLLPTTAVDRAGAATLAQHAAELAFANLPKEHVIVEVVQVHDV
jgi:hypothetical protein